uniref:Putative secreted protein n=1 Tax=Anopheles darlingi TaxID=43151 RepID=A0A2M4D1V3_ANODA
MESVTFLIIFATDVNAEEEATNKSVVTEEDICRSCADCCFLIPSVTRVVAAAASAFAAEFVALVDFSHFIFEVAGFTSTVIG